MLHGKFLFALVMVRASPKSIVCGASAHHPLVYFHPNIIHAFEVDGNCESKPEEKALVTVWARSNAHERNNDYGTTHLCESAKHQGTPGERGTLIQCDLREVKW